MKRLNEILTGIASLDSNDIIVKGVASDSRAVLKGFVFVAIKGELTNGHQYISNAIENGAVAIIVEDDYKSDKVIIVKVANTRLTLGLLAANFYDHPSKQFKLIGVTGTNGKTTTASLLFQMAKKLGYKTGLISTIDYRINNQVFESKFTTPDAVKLQGLMSEMVEANCEYVFMEVSSHAIHQNRIAGLIFDVGVFTNITHEHLDYHKDFKEYIHVKKTFFDNLDPKAIAITNIDDRNGLVMVQNCKASIKQYALRKMADYKGRVLSNDMFGLHLKLNEVEVYLKLGGEFNAYNMLAVFAVANELELATEDEILAIASDLAPVEGRMEMIRLDVKKAIAIVDYAHTPDALENVLQSIKMFKPKGIITVFGCGGDRDKTKRPKMGAIACQYSDKVILTSDNPRTEDPEAIINEIIEGLDDEQKKEVLCITDREQGIKVGLSLLSENEVLLVAGKGHEKYQEINGVKSPFDDKRKIIAFS